MTAVFINVPEQHAGNPLSIADAIERVASLGVILKGRWPDMPDAHDLSWVILSSSISAGTPTYVRSPSSGRYARIPLAYWGDLAAGDSPPALFDGMPASVGADPDMIGEPIVLWESDLEVAFTFMLNLVKQALGNAAEPAPTMAGITAKLGRRPGTTPYPKDAEIVERAIALCDGGSFTGPARIRRALKTMIGEIEGDGSDENKLIRLRNKALEARPDLKD